MVFVVKLWSYKWKSKRHKTWLLHFYYDKTTVRFRKGIVAHIVHLANSKYSLACCSSSILLYNDASCSTKGLLYLCTGWKMSLPAVSHSQAALQMSNLIKTSVDVKQHKAGFVSVDCM